MKISPTSKRMYRCAAVFFFLLLSALFINQRHAVFEIGFQVAEDFLFLVLSTAIICFVYALWISEVYVSWHSTSRRWHRLVDGGIYVLIAAAPVFVVDTLLLRVLATPVRRDLFAEGYWPGDFLFLALPTLAYTLCVYFCPQWRLSSMMPWHVHSKRQLLIAKWRDEGDTYALWKYLNDVLVPGPVFAKEKVRLFDILMIVYENHCYFFVLTNGEKLATRLISSDFERWHLAGWFIKVERCTYVNFLHVCHAELARKQLVLREPIRQRIAYTSVYPLVTEKLKVKRKLETNLSDFLSNRGKLPDTGWEKMVSL